MMKRILLAGLTALALAAAAQPARASCMFEYSCSRHLSFVHTSKNRCFSYSSCATPLPCAPGCGYAGPALWDGFAGYGAPSYGAAPVAAAPAASTTPTPAATTPSFTPPQPKSTGVQQAGYFYYGQTASPSYNAGYNYGGYLYYGQGYGHPQAPNYWYDN